jgi:hypothetical protein
LPNRLLDVTRIPGCLCLREGLLLELATAVELVKLMLGRFAVEDPDGVELGLLAEEDAVEETDEVAGLVAVGVGGRVDAVVREG